MVHVSASKEPWVQWNGYQRYLPLQCPVSCTGCLSYAASVRVGDLEGSDSEAAHFTC